MRLGQILHSPVTPAPAFKTGFAARSATDRSRPNPAKHVEACRTGAAEPPCTVAASMHTVYLLAIAFFKKPPPPPPPPPEQLIDPKFWFITGAAIVLVVLVALVPSTILTAMLMSKEAKKPKDELDSVHDPRFYNHRARSGPRPVVSSTYTPPAANVVADTPVAEPTDSAAARPKSGMPIVYSRARKPTTLSKIGASMKKVASFSKKKA